VCKNGVHSCFILEVFFFHLHFFIVFLPFFQQISAVKYSAPDPLSNEKRIRSIEAKLTKRHTLMCLVNGIKKTYYNMGKKIMRPKLSRKKLTVVREGNNREQWCKQWHQH